MAAQRSRKGKGDRRSCQEKARSTFQAASKSPAERGRRVDGWAGRRIAVVA